MLMYIILEIHSQAMVLGLSIEHIYIFRPVRGRTYLDYLKHVQNRNKTTTLMLVLFKLMWSNDRILEFQNMFLKYNLPIKLHF